MTCQAISFLPPQVRPGPEGGGGFAPALGGGSGANRAASGPGWGRMAGAHHGPSRDRCVAGDERSPTQAGGVETGRAGIARRKGRARPRGRGRTGPQAARGGWELPARRAAPDRGGRSGNGTRATEVTDDP